MSEPTKAAYTQEEILAELRAWMIAEIGAPMEKEPEARDGWYRDYGLIAHFLMDKFPK